MKTIGVPPEAFPASISLLSRSEIDAMPKLLSIAVKGHPTLANRRRAHPRGALARCLSSVAGALRFLPCAQTRKVGWKTGGENARGRAAGALLSHDLRATGLRSHFK